MNFSLLLKLFWIFAPLSLLTVGGGQTVLPDIHRQIVLVNQYISEAQFLVDFTITRMAPGPASLLVSLIGLQVAGWPGLLVASVAIFVPPSLLILLIARIWARNEGAVWQSVLARGIAPIAAGLMLSATVTIARSLQLDWLAGLVMLVSTVLMLTTKLNPLWVIAGGAGVFLLMGA